MIMSKGLRIITCVDRQFLYKLQQFSSTDSFSFWQHPVQSLCGYDQVVFLAYRVLQNILWLWISDVILRAGGEKQSYTSCA